MPETFSGISWHNDTSPAINETALNRIEVGIETIDDRAASLELGISTPVIVPFATSVTLNVTQGSLFRCVASGDITLDAIVGGTDGQTVVFEVQASGAQRTLHFTGSTDTVDIDVGQWWVGVFRHVASAGAWLRDDVTTGSSGAGNDLNILAPQTISWASTITPNAAVGALFRVAAVGDFTLAAPINGTDGQQITVVILASGGARELTIDAAVLLTTGLSANVTIASGKRQILELAYDGVLAAWLLVRSIQQL